jgi:tetratricopeptide (TPR) repeat protein
MSDASKAAIKTPNGSIYGVISIIAEDVTSDLIKLQADIKSSKVQYLTINKAAPEVGEKVVIIGSPVGLESTVSYGIISAVRDVPGFGSIIQTTAPISPGSSGSPVVNMKGEVLGVASAQMREGQNLNFVIPSAKIIELNEKKQAPSFAKKGKGGTQADDIISTAMFYYLKDNNEKALPFFIQYLQTHSENYIAWFYAGVCYGVLDRLEEEIQAYKQAIRLKPDIAEAHYNIGLAYGKLGRLEEEIQAYKQAIRLKPDYAKAHLNLGAAYGSLDRNEEEIQALKQAIRLKPDYAMAHKNLGAVYGSLNRYEEAMHALKQAIRLKPDYAEAHFYIGLTHLMMGDRGSALEEYKILKELDEKKANELFNLIYK